MCQVKITKKLILYFIRKPEEERKYNMSMIQVNVTFHYTTLANSETQGRLCNVPDTFYRGPAPRGGDTLPPHTQSNLPKSKHYMF